MRINIAALAIFNSSTKTNETTDLTKQTSKNILMKIFCFLIFFINIKFLIMKTFIKSQFAYGTSGRRPVTLIGMKGILFLFLFTLSLNAQVSSYLVHSKEDTNQKCNHFNEFLKDKVKVDKLIALDISIDENNYLKISPNGKSHILNRATDESFIEEIPRVNIYCQIMKSQY